MNRFIGVKYNKGENDFYAQIIYDKKIFIKKGFLTGLKTAEYYNKFCKFNCIWSKKQYNLKMYEHELKEIEKKQEQKPNNYYGDKQCIYCVWNLKK